MTPLDLQQGMWVAYQRMRGMIQWQMDRCLREGELTGYAVERIEKRIEEAEDLVRDKEYSEAVAKLTNAAIYLGRSMYVR